MTKLQNYPGKKRIEFSQSYLSIVSTYISHNNHAIDIKPEWEEEWESNNPITIKWGYFVPIVEDKSLMFTIIKRNRIW